MASKPQLKVLMDLSDGLEVNETSALCFDISDIVITANTRRGRNREIDKIQAGYCVITVIDDNGDFNPDNTASPYYGKLVPGKKLRLYPLYDDGTGDFRYPDIFTGYITNYRTDFSIGVNEANKIVIEAYDGMKIFNSVSITEVVNATSGDFSDERIEAILDEITWPTGLTLLETSAIELDADQGELRTVLDALRQVEDTEAGLLYFDGSGVFQFKNRATVATTPTFDAANAFSDAGQYIGYNDIRLIQDDATLLNEITVVSYNGSNEATAVNSTSQDTYFVRSAERRNVLLSATSDLQDLADTLLANYQDPSLQIERIVLNLAEYEAVDRLVAAFYFDIFFIPIYVEKNMPGDTLISRIGWIQGLNHDITKNTWMVTAFTGLTSIYENIPNWLTDLYGSNTGTTDYVTFNAGSLRLSYDQIAFDSNDNIFISGDRWNGQFFTKLNNKGQVLLKKLTTAMSFTKNRISALLPDNNDGVFMCFSSNNTEAYVSRLDSNLDWVWGRKLPSTYYGRLAQTVSSGGNLYALGYSTYSTTYESAYIIKYDIDGNILKQNRLYDGTNNVEPWAMAINDNNKIAIAAYNKFDAFNDYYYVAKLNASCEIEGQTLLKIDNATYQIELCAIDNNDNIYVVLQIYGPVGNIPMAILKLNASNEIEWYKTYKSPNSYTLWVNNAYFDGSNNLICQIYLNEYNELNKGVLAKFDTDGTLTEQIQYWSGTNDSFWRTYNKDSTGRHVVAGSIEIIQSGYPSATVISFTPTWTTNYGTYTIWGSQELVYGSGDLVSSTTYTATTVVSSLTTTTETYTDTSFTYTIVDTTTEVVTIEF